MLDVQSEEDLVVSVIMTIPRIRRYDCEFARAPIFNMRNRKGMQHV